jgi:hypothetical protein
VTETVTPNWFATIALLSWPLVALWLFRTRPVNQAILWTILGGLLLLPVKAFIKLAPGIPQLDKVSIPNLATLVGLVFAAGRPLRIWKRIGLVEVLLLGFVIGPLITSGLNGDPISVGGGITLPSVDYYDGVSAAVSQLIFLLPFFLGRQFLRSAADTFEILRVLVIAGLLYSVPLLIEIRLSPQLHYWFYGYQPSQFIQGMRFGGYRPMAFMGHGLLAAFFVMTTAVAAAALWRTQTRVVRFAPAGVTAYLSAILILCKTLGALVYGAALVPVARWTKPRIQVRMASALVMIVLLYPALRIADLVPVQSLINVATSISEDRARSLQFRFDNEQRLLDRASQRLAFGWGRWGRSRVYDEKSGKDESVTDGRWIISMGQFGIFGFLAEFGLLALPVFRAAAALRFAESMREGVMLAALSLIVAIDMIDLLPNSSLSPFSWLLAGALLGRAELLRATATQLSKSDVDRLFTANARPTKLGT